LFNFINGSIQGSYLGEKKAINAVESKLAYLRQIEAFCEARANKHCERDLHVHIKEIHSHMRETELKKKEK
jgi:hypothetical protein